MRYSRAFIPTLKEEPSDAQVASHKLMVRGGYIRPLYLSPIYQDRRLPAFKLHRGELRYDKGICPVAERLHEREVLLTAIARPPATTTDMADVVTAIRKVMAAIPELQASAATA